MERRREIEKEVHRVGKRKENKTGDRNLKKPRRWQIERKVILWGIGKETVRKKGWGNSGRVKERKKWRENIGKDEMMGEERRGKIMGELRKGRNCGRIKERNVWW
jgi:hypothetical protein